VFADLKNDFVFRTIFTRRPDLLCGLLNDLLERQGDQAITEIEYLPSEQLPLAQGAKYSILDVRCRERSGVTFVVEMQLLHVAGFGNRVVYNACRAYAGQLGPGDPYTKLADVVAVTICDFTLWPDDAQDAAGLPRVPMLSRWNMAERTSGSPGLLQVQYAFLELPKLPPGPPRTPAALWAWLFVHTKKLTAMPPDLPPGPYREVVELAKEAMFTWSEVDAIRKVFDEIELTRLHIEQEVAKGVAKGQAEILAKGLAKGLERGRLAGRVDALLTVLARRGLEPTPEQRARIEGCGDVGWIDRWFDRAITATSVAEVLEAPGS